MALTQFIKDLLYIHDKLIIPGFGGFVAQYTPAHINDEKNLISPPGKYFIFDASLTEDDDILAKYISRKNSTTLAEARKAVKEMADDFRRKLNEGITLYIEDVGYLMQDDKKIIRFKRKEDQNFLADSFGLEPVAFKAPTPDILVPEETFVPTKKKSNFVKILVIFLLINLVGALSAIIYWKFDDIKSYIAQFTSKKDVVPVQDTVDFHVDPDTSELGQYIDTTTNIKNALRYEETQMPDSVPTVTEPEKTYYIIAGSFQRYDKAEIHANILKKQGFNPEIIEFSQDLFRISVGEYKGKDEAVKQLEIIKAKKGTEKAWLLAK